MAPGYVVNQLNFVSSYVVTPGSLLAATAPPTFAVSGSFGPSLATYAQFEAEFNYTFTPFAPLPGNYGAPVPLGRIRYKFDAATPNLPFISVPVGVDSNTTIGFTTAATGILEVHGYAWIAGDPFQLQLTTVPEPTTAAALATTTLLLRRRRRRTR